MPKSPPYCLICQKDFSKNVDRLHYCICDIAVCDNCVNSLKKSDNSWICPKCEEENDIKKSKLFRLK